MCLRVVRLDTNGFAKLSYGLLDLALPSERDPQIEMALSFFGVGLNCLPELLEARFILSGPCPKGNVANH